MSTVMNSASEEATGAVREYGVKNAQRAASFIAEDIERQPLPLCLICEMIDGFDYAEFARWYYDKSLDLAPIPIAQKQKETFFQNYERGAAQRVEIAISRYKDSRYTKDFINALFSECSRLILYVAILRYSEGEIVRSESGIKTRRKR